VERPGRPAVEISNLFYNISDGMKIIWLNLRFLQNMCEWIAVGAYVTGAGTHSTDTCFTEQVVAKTLRQYTSEQATEGSLLPVTPTLPRPVCHCGSLRCL
jgi:hypothetical protein